MADASSAAPKKRSRGGDDDDATPDSKSKPKRAKKPSSSDRVSLRVSPGLKRKKLGDLSLDSFRFPRREGKEALAHAEAVEDPDNKGGSDGLHDDIADHSKNVKPVAELVQNLRDETFVKALDLVIAQGQVAAGSTVQVLRQQQGAVYEVFIVVAEPHLSPDLPMMCLGYIYCDPTAEMDKEQDLVRHDVPENSTICGVFVCVNFGTELMECHLNNGASSKRSDPRCIGNFGTGLKRTLAAIVGRHLPMDIYMHRRRWNFQNKVLKGQKAYRKQLVLVKRRLKTNRYETCIVLWGLRPSETKLDQFLFLHPADPQTVTEEPFGQLLLAKRFEGHVFCKGMFVGMCPRLVYGVNLFHLRLTEDRRTLDHAQITHLACQLWLAAIAKTPDLFSRYYDILKDTSDKWDVLDIRLVLAEQMDQGRKFATQVASHFMTNHPNTIPVATGEEWSMMKRINKVPILVNPLLLRVLHTSGEMKSAQAEYAEAMSKFATEAEGHFQPHHLPVRERVLKACGTAKTEIVFQSFGGDGKAMMEDCVFHAGKYCMNIGLLEPEHVHRRYPDICSPCSAAAPGGGGSSDPCSCCEQVAFHLLLQVMQARKATDAAGRLTGVLIAEAAQSASLLTETKAQKERAHSLEKLLQEQADELANMKREAQQRDFKREEETKHEARAEESKEEKKRTVESSDDEEEDDDEEDDDAEPGQSFGHGDAKRGHTNSSRLPSDHPVTEADGEDGRILLLAKLEASKLETGRLTEKLGASERQIAALQNELTKLQSELHGAQGEVAILDNMDTIVKLQHQIESLEKDYAEEKKKNTVAASEMHVLQIRCAHQAECIQRLNEERQAGASVKREPAE